MIVRKSKPGEARRINELFAICFNFPYENCPIDPDNDTDDHWVALTDDGEMMSNFTIPDLSAWFDGHVCRLGGIGAVATLPQYRRQGGIRACFEAALPDMYAQGYELSYLFPFSTFYYRKFGYECCVQKLLWEVDLRQLSPGSPGGTFRLAEQKKPMTAAIRLLDQQWEHKYNLMIQHSEKDYGWTEEFDPAVKQEFTYVCFDELGTPKAYTTYKLDSGHNLQCSRFCFADREGFRLLMALFKSMAADHERVCFQTPVVTGFQYLLPEWSLGAAKWTLQASSGMVRVINVRKILEKAAYRGSGRVLLAIQDAQIPENCGTWAVSFENGQAVSVMVSEDAPDARLTISAFSALIAGVCELEEAADNLTGLEIVNPAAPLRQVFYRKPMMIVDNF